MKIIYWCVLSLSIILSSCKKDDTALEEFLKKEHLNVAQLIADWKWENSSGGWGGSFLTPETEGYNKTITFDNDRNYIEYIDSELSLKTAYRIEHIAFSEIQGADQYRIYYFDSKSYQSFLIKQDTDTHNLIFYDGCKDCIGTHVYSIK